MHFAPFCKPLSMLRFTPNNALAEPRTEITRSTVWVVRRLCLCHLLLLQLLV